MEKHDYSNEGIILVLGVTGSGKSYFLNKLRSHSVKEGHSLQSETAQCQAVQILLDDDDVEDQRSITVVDTPGFDDTNRPQGEILTEITEFLATQHALGVPLRGVLYLHKITDNRMTGSSLTYLNLLRSLVGEDALGNVILVTSMWNRLRDDDHDRAIRREQELIDKYWGPMQKKGSYVSQFDGTTESAFGLVYQLAGKDSVVLNVQREIMDQDESVLGTSAGEGLARKLEQDIKVYRAEVAELEAQLQEERKAKPQNSERIQMLQENKAKMEILLGLAKESMERMRVRPRSSIRERLMQALKEKGRDAAFALATALHITLTVVQLVSG
ncbi:AIG1-type G domain-containing protein [Fusarium sp. LHS14.1]|nr:AIG1-type G domain-containing protein [Fusarium sp. LHS14.1]